VGARKRGSVKRGRGGDAERGLFGFVTLAADGGKGSGRRVRYISGVQGPGECSGKRIGGSGNAVMMCKKKRNSVEVRHKVGEIY